MGPLVLDVSAFLSFLLWIHVVVLQKKILSFLFIGTNPIPTVATTVVVPAVSV